MPTREPQHGWVDTGEIRLHYWDWAGGEPALLCIHGLTANGRVWDALADRVGDRHRIIAVDLRGRGLSDKPAAGQYGLEAHARDMAAVVRSLGGQPVVPVGSSLGAYISLLLAGDHPDLVSRVVLVDGGGSTDALTKLELEKQGTTVMGRLSMVFPSMNAYFDFWRCGAPYIPWTPCFERYLEADMETRPDGSVVCRSFTPGILEDLATPPIWKVEERAPRVSAPTLVFWAPLGMGEGAPPAFSRATQEQLTSLLPNGCMVTVEGSNHHTIVMSPECVNKMVQSMEDFLQT